MGDLADRAGDEAHHHQIDPAERAEQRQRRDDTGPQRHLVRGGCGEAGHFDVVLLIGGKIGERLARHVDRLGRGRKARQRFGRAAFG